jgi:hypothetical protein
MYFWVPLVKTWPFFVLGLCPVWYSQYGPIFILGPAGQNMAFFGAGQNMAFFVFGVPLVKTWPFSCWSKHGLF